MLLRKLAEKENDNEGNNTKGRKICRKYPEFVYIISTNKQLEFISTDYRLSKKINHVSIDKLAILLEQAQFSNKQLTDIECRFSMQILKLIRRNITFHI